MWGRSRYGLILTVTRAVFLLADIIVLDKRSLDVTGKVS